MLKRNYFRIVCCGILCVFFLLGFIPIKTYAEGATGIIIVSEPEDARSSVGDTFQLTVEATGVASYQWQYSSNAGKTWYPLNWKGGKSATLTSPAMAENRMDWVFRCVLTDAEGNTLTTRTVSITKPEKFEILTEPEDIEIQAGDTFQLTVEATGVASYQWQYSSNAGKAWYPINWKGGKSATFTSPAMAENRMDWVFRCVLTDAEGNTLTTRTVSITKPEKFEILTEPEDIEIQAGDLPDSE